MLKYQTCVICQQIPTEYYTELKKYKNNKNAVQKFLYASIL